MHHDDVPPHWKLIQVPKSKNTCGRPYRRKDRHIILTLWGFETMACGHSICAQLWAIRLGHQKVTCTSRQRDRQRHKHIRLTGPKCGEIHHDAGPPYRKLIQIQKSQNSRGHSYRRTDRRTDGHIIVPNREFTSNGFLTVHIGYI